MESDNCLNNDLGENNKSVKRLKLNDNEEDTAVECAAKDDLDENNKSVKRLKPNDNEEDAIAEDTDEEEEYIDLESKTVVELKAIATSLGISSNNRRKINLIEQITSIYKRNREAIEKEEIDSNINSFNKSIEFTIFEGIDPLEWLFWKAFRNKFIYRRIMSFMDKDLTPSYDSIISINRMVKSNQFEILRDKVVRNQYVVFESLCYNKASSGYEYLDDFREIYKNIKNYNRDRIFYQQLFKNNHILLLINNDQRFSHRFVNQIIKEKCLVALDALIQEKIISPLDENNLYEALSFGSKKVTKYILNSLGDPLNLKLDEKKLTSAYYFNPIKSLKIILEVDNSKFKNQQFIKSFLKGQEIRPEMKLESLLAANKIIQDVINETTSEISIDTSFSNWSTEQLNSKLSDSTNNKDNEIKKQLDYYYSFTGLAKSQFYYLGFSNEQELNSFQFDVSNHGIANFRMAFQYGNYPLLCSWFKREKQISKGTIQSTESLFRHEFKIIEPKPFQLLFTHCDDKIKQMEFINAILSDLNGETSNNTIVDPIFLFYLVISYDDLELIKHVVNGLGELLKQCLSSYNLFFYAPYIITRYIRSTTVLDYLFETFDSTFTTTAVNMTVPLWLFFPTLELVQHFEKINNSFKRIVDEPTTSVWNNFEANSNSKPILEYILSNTTIEKKRISQFFILIGYLYRSDSKLEKLKLLSSCPLDFSIPSLYPKFIEETPFRKYFQWLLKDVKEVEELKKWGTKIVGSSNNHLLLYHIGRFDEIDLNQTDQIISLLGYIAKDGNIQCLDKILAHFFLPKNVGIFKNLGTFRILLSAAEYGRLDIMHFIYSKYPQMLIKKTNSNNGVFELALLKKLIFVSLQSNYIKQCEFLFDLISITKNEFQNHSTTLSKLYFLNKFK